VEEVAAVIASMIADKALAEAYSRPAYKSLVGNYYTADSVTTIESNPPFAAAAFSAAAATAGSPK
jgi:hypothetical protein